MAGVVPYRVQQARIDKGNDDFNFQGQRSSYYAKDRVLGLPLPVKRVNVQNGRSFSSDVGYD